LIQDGGGRRASDHASNLRNIRIKHATWVTADIARNLGRFEGALRSIGIDSHFLGSTPDLSDEERKAKLAEIDENMASLFPELFGGKPGQQEASAQKTIQHVRDLLDIESLVKLRSELIRRAYASLTADG
jgi:hypothetical protein